MEYIWALAVLAAIEAAVVCVLAYTAAVQRKKIDAANQIRVGYEKKCNTFRIKYTVLSKLERQELIIRRVRDLGRPVYIYGGGIIGKKLEAVLKQDPDISIEGILESSELKRRPAGERLREDAAVIITPLFDYDRIVPLLSAFTQEKNIIGIDEIID